MKDNPNPNRLYKDIEHKVISGVCAGIADYFDVERWIVRLITIILFMVYSLPTLLAYVIASFMLEAKPAHLYKDSIHESFWKDIRRSPRDTFGNTRYKFRELDKRLQVIERYLTSKKFKLDREFDKL